MFLKNSVRDPLLLQTALYVCVIEGTAEVYLVMAWLHILRM